MNLDTIPDQVWTKLSNEAISGASLVEDLFYDHIYSKWSEGQVRYKSNLADETDAGWGDLVAEWKKIEMSGKTLGTALHDDTVGIAQVQGRKGPDKEVRLWEKYNEKARGDRFQFVVNEGGGMVLFNRMRRACQQFIFDKLGHDPEKFVVRGWKVFGEEQGEGRSDSCCVYTAVKYTDPQLEELVENYVWPNIKDLVNSQFTPLGFYKVCNKPLWAMPMPAGGLERRVLGVESYGSAGGLMGNIFAEAYANAVTKDYKNAQELSALAKEEARQLIAQLYP